MTDILDSEEALLRSENERLWRHRAVMMVKELGRYVLIYGGDKAEVREQEQKLLSHVEKLHDPKKLERFCDRLHCWYKLFGVTMPTPEALKKLDEPEDLW